MLRSTAPRGSAAWPPPRRCECSARRSSAPAASLFHRRLPPPRCLPRHPLQGPAASCPCRALLLWDWHPPLPSCHDGACCQPPWQMGWLPPRHSVAPPYKLLPRGEREARECRNEGHMHRHESQWAVTFEVAHDCNRLDRLRRRRCSFTTLYLPRLQPCRRRCYNPCCSRRLHGAAKKAQSPPGLELCFSRHALWGRRRSQPTMIESKQRGY